ncbi:retinol dehydrogenase 14 isoform X2 [Vespula maculifrons]|uniref:Retinol dehydrogenase 14 isoform X2 n=1 Tax=Vespula maculifrons TaxID=7453 RepID=A0ABD2CQP7_VESMC
MFSNIIDGLSVSYLVVFSVISLHLIIYWNYFYRTINFCENNTRMVGKTVLITGCTSGIGKETAKDLAKRGAKVIMACRNIDLANKIKEDIIKETDNCNINVHELDLCSFQSIRKFARQINEEESKLNVLIHNAGIAQFFRNKVSEDNLEITMQTNHYGPFLLTHLLIDLLKKSKPSRIIVVSSLGYRFASINLNNPNPTNAILPCYLYLVSKRANVVFTLELARRLEGTGILVNCLHPGIIESNLFREFPIKLYWLLKFVLKPFFITAEEGAQTTIYLAVSEEVKVSGKYFKNCAEASLTKKIKDSVLGEKFWEISERIVKLQPTDPKI